MRSLLGLLWSSDQKRLVAGSLLGLLWGRARKSLFSHFRVTLSFGGSEVLGGQQFVKGQAVLPAQSVQNNPPQESFKDQGVFKEMTFKVSKITSASKVFALKLVSKGIVSKGVV